MSRGDQVSRQWKILQMLERARHGLKVAELCERLEGVASERTIFRDIGDLQQSGFPLEAVEGRWKLAEGAGIASVPIFPSELLSLLVAADLLDLYRSSDLAKGLASLREKVSAMVSVPAWKASREGRRSLLGTFTAPGLFADEDERVEAIEHAIRMKHRLELQYRAPGQELTTRRVDPYSMWFADGRLYLIGWCHLRSDFRTFHASRIQEAVALDEPFERDASFDAKTFVGAGFGVWSGKQYEVELVFDADVAHVPAERRLHESQRCETLADGRVVLTMSAGGMPQLATWLAGFGGLVRVEKPPVLRHLVAEIHRRGAQAYCSEDQVLETAS